MTRDAIAEYHARALPPEQRRGRGRRQPRARRRRRAGRDGLPSTAPAAPARARRRAAAHRTRCPSPCSSAPTRAGAPRARDARAARATTPTASRSACSNQVLGGGMSSRLFQEVREQRGLAYSVYSYRGRVRGHRRVRRLRRHRARAGRRDARRARRRELDRLVADGGVTDRELDAAKGHLTGSLALVARELGQPDAPPRPQRADARRGPDARRAGRRGRGGHAPTTSPGSIDRVLRAGSAARSPVVGPSRAPTDLHRI